VGASSCVIIKESLHGRIKQSWVSLEKWMIYRS